VQGIQGNGGKADEGSENRSGTRRILGNGVREGVDVTPRNLTLNIYSAYITSILKAHQFQFYHRNLFGLNYRL